LTGNAAASEEVFDRFGSEWIDLDNVEFYRGLLRRQLLINRCEDCGNWYQPPWPTCPACWSANVTPTKVSGVGAVHTFAIPPGSDTALAVIDLAEQHDLRASGQIVDCPAQDVKIGMPVDLCWLERDGHPVPAFRPVPRPKGSSA
jgi:uncharacterized OB-fold protein